MWSACHRSVHRSHVHRVAACAAVLGLAVACSSSGDDAAPTTRVATPPTPPTTPPATQVVSGACAAPNQIVDRIDVLVDGVGRYALVDVSATAPAGEPLAVVLSFHGAGMDADAQRTIDGLVDASTDAVIVHPQGLIVDIDDQVRQVAGWDVQGNAVDETAFVTALLDELATRVCIDPARVWATGLSNGGAMALSLACRLPDRISAVAPVAGGYVPVDCPDAGAVPVIAFHGLDDLVTPYEGSGPPAQTLLPVYDVIAAQAERNGCSGEPGVTSAFGITTYTWTGCEAATVLYALPDHGHAWPGRPLPVTAEVLASTMTQDEVMTAKGLTPETQAENMLLTNGLDATSLILRFFADQS